MQSLGKALSAEKNLLFLEEKRIKSERKVRFHLEQVQRLLFQLSSEQATLKTELQLW